MPTKKYTTAKTSVKRHAAKHNTKHTTTRTHKSTHHHAKSEPKTQPKTMGLIIVGAVILGFVFVMMNYSVMNMDKTYTTSTTTPAPSVVSAEEKKKIEQWILDENLNAYGDEKGTIYIGGTPLFDESTGQYKDLYEYIVARHPDRPWNN